ncbi:MAG TPA: MaoC family dehydratase [Bryobacteraceae bacterium]|nr:MaoC family dehydratase [Bryobacteraceae bacterium]
MILSGFSVPAADRYFEDYEPGLIYEFGSVKMTEADIVDFARRYDPQSFHVDPVRAAQGRFGGLIASGWHTIAVAMRLLVDHYLPDVAAMASPGVDEVRWPVPVRPGDTLRVRITNLEAKLSRSKPDRGIVRARMEALNQNDQVVMSMLVMAIIGRRPPA